MSDNDNMFEDVKEGVEELVKGDVTIAGKRIPKIAIVGGIVVVGGLIFMLSKNKSTPSSSSNNSNSEGLEANDFGLSNTEALGGGGFSTSNPSDFESSLSEDAFYNEKRQGDYNDHMLTRGFELPFEELDPIDYGSSDKLSNFDPVMPYSDYGQTDYSGGYSSSYSDQTQNYSTPQQTNKLNSFGSKQSIPNTKNNQKASVQQTPFAAINRAINTVKPQKSAVQQTPFAAINSAITKINKSPQSPPPNTSSKISNPFNVTVNRIGSNVSTTLPRITPNIPPVKKPVIPPIKPPVIPTKKPLKK